MGYKDGLKQVQSNLDPLAALRSPVTVLLGVSDSASQTLNGIGLKTVFDLATSPFFAIAAQVAAGGDGIETELNSIGNAIPGGLVVEGGPSDIAGLARADLGVLRVLSSAQATDLKANLQVDTVGDLGRWPPYRAAREILDALGKVTSDGDGAAELVPKLGQYPTERRFYSTIVLDQVSRQDTVDLATAGPIDISPALSADFGFSSPAVGARLTFEQSWFAQGFALGNLLHSLALAPGESTRIAVLDWSRRTSAASSESISESERLTNETTHNRAVSEVQDAVAKETQSGFSHAESSATTEEAGGGFGLALGPVLIGGAGGIGHSTTSADSFSSSSGSRNLSASMSQKVMDTTQQAASSARNRRASIVQEVSQQEHESVSTRIVANYNHMHALTIQYYEVVELYRVSVALNEVERLLFVPVKLLEFTDVVVRKYQGILARAALDRRALELLTTEFGSVKLTPSIRMNPLAGTHVGVRTLPVAARMVAETTASASSTATSTTDAATSTAGSSSTTPASSNPNIPTLPDWDRAELARVARMTSSNIARADSSAVFLPANTLLVGLTVSADQPGPPISAVTIKPSNGGAPIALTQTSIDWRVPSAISLQDVSAVVITTQASGSFPGSVTLDLEYLGSRIPLTVPFMAGPNATNEVFTISAPETGAELLTHLNSNGLYYNQAIWRSLDASTTALLLSKFRFENQPVANLIDPKPVQIAGNYLVFRMPGFVARKNLVEPPDSGSGSTDSISRMAWRKWMDEKGLSFGPESTIEQLVPVPTGGVFAEAILGRSNSAEKLDVTRFWNWQDSPIPLQPPEIAAINMESRAQAIDLRPGQLGQPVLNIVNPTALPDPTGLGAIVGALQNGNMFRDMSAAAATIGLAQATGSNATSAAADAARLASSNLQVAAQHDIESKKIELAKEALKNQEANGGTPKNISEMGSLINSAGDRDRERAAEWIGRNATGSGSSGSSSSGSSGTGSSSGGTDIMPSVGDTMRSLTSGSSSTGTSLKDDAFKRAIHGALGVPVSDLIEAGQPVGVDAQVSSRAFIVEGPEFTPENRAFNPSTNDKSGKITLSVSVPRNMPDGGIIRWSVPPRQPPGYFGGVTFSSTPRAGDTIHIGEKVEVFAGEPGLTAIDVEVVDADGKVSESQKYTLSVPQFVVVRESITGEFDDWLRNFRVDDIKDTIAQSIRDVSERLLRNSNVRTIWQLGSFIEPIPENITADLLTSVTLRNEPPVSHPGLFGTCNSFTQDGKPVCGPRTFNESAELYPGGFDNFPGGASFVNEVDTETAAIVLQLLQDGGNPLADPALKQLAGKIFGRFIGEDIAHEIIHGLIGLDIVPPGAVVSDKSHNIPGGPVSDIMNHGYLRSFSQRTGIEDTAHATPLRVSNFVDHGIEAIPGLGPDNQARMDKLFPTSPPLKPLP